MTPAWDPGINVVKEVFTRTLKNVSESAYQGAFKLWKSWYFLYKPYIYIYYYDTFGKHLCIIFFT